MQKHSPLCWMTVPSSWWRAGDAKVDNKKYKSTFHKKASMLKVDELTELVGHPVGGVCPFGINEGVRVYLDQSLRRFPSVFPACGSANSAIELTIPELEIYSRFEEWVGTCARYRNKNSRIKIPEQREQPCRENSWEPVKKSL